MACVRREESGGRESASSWSTTTRRTSRRSASSCGSPGRGRPCCGTVGGITAERPDTGVIEFSGWHQLRTPAIIAGADAFVPKPDFDRLEQLLAKRGAARQLPTGKTHERGSRRHRRACRRGVAARSPSRRALDPRPPRGRRLRALAFPVPALAVGGPAEPADRPPALVPGGSDGTPHAPTVRSPTPFRRYAPRGLRPRDSFARPRAAFFVGEPPGSGPSCTSTPTIAIATMSAVMAGRSDWRRDGATTKIGRARHSPSTDHS